MKRFETDELFDDRLLGWLWTSVSPVLLIVGTVSNLLSLIVIIATPSFRKGPAGFALGALSAVDTGVLVTSVLRRWLSHAYDWDIATTSTVSCRTHFYLAHLFTQLSSWTVAVLSADRAVCIGRPFARVKTATYVTRRRVVLAWITVCLALAAVNGHFYWTAVRVGSVDRDGRSDKIVLDEMIGQSTNMMTHQLNTANTMPTSADSDPTAIESKRTPTSGVSTTDEGATFSTTSVTSFMAAAAADNSLRHRIVAAAPWIMSVLSRTTRKIYPPTPAMMTVGYTLERDDGKSSVEDPVDFYCLISQSYMSFYLHVWYWIDVVLWDIVPFTIIVVSNSFVIFSVRRSAQNLSTRNICQLHSTRCRRDSHPHHQHHQQLQLGISTVSNATAGGVWSTASSALPSSSSSSNCNGRRLSPTGVTLLVVSGVFLLTTSPTVIYMAFCETWIARAVTQSDVARIRLVHCLCSLIYYAGNASNFALYCLSGPHFRRAFLNLLTTTWRRCRRADSVKSMGETQTGSVRVRSAATINGILETTAFRGNQRSGSVKLC